MRLRRHEEAASPSYGVSPIPSQCRALRPASCAPAPGVERRRDQTLLWRELAGEECEDAGQDQAGRPAVGPAELLRRDTGLLALLAGEQTELSVDLRLQALGESTWP